MITNDILIKNALSARKNSYSPYSGFAVGAALECADGTIVTGCNIENAAYGPSMCAERTAIFKAVSEGKKEFTKIAIVGGQSDATHLDLCSPCGVCRQVMNEFCDSDFKIVLAEVESDTIINITEYTLSELLPLGFGPKNLSV